MVTSVRNTRGAGTPGCLLSLLLTGVVVYYGMQVGRVWYRYYAIRDKIDSAALYAQAQPTDEILRNLRQAADDIGLPAEAKKFQIKRTDVYPRTITISTVYTEKLNLPFVTRTVTFRPSATHSQ